MVSQSKVFTCPSGDDWHFSVSPHSAQGRRCAHTESEGACFLSCCFLVGEKPELLKDRMVLSDVNTQHS